MAATVFIPPSLRRFTNEARTITVNGDTLRAVIDDLEAQCPGLLETLVDNGQLRSGIAVAIDGVVSGVGLLAPVPENADLHIIPAIGGG